MKVVETKTVSLYLGWNRQGAKKRHEEAWSKTQPRGDETTAQYGIPFKKRGLS